MHFWGLEFLVSILILVEGTLQLIEAEEDGDKLRVSILILVEGTLQLVHQVE